MPKPGSKLRIRLIDPDFPDIDPELIPSATYLNKSTYIWVSLVKKLEYSTGQGPSYQKKTMFFDNEMLEDLEKSERKVKVRRVTHKARGLYPDEPPLNAQFDPLDIEEEYIEVEDVKQFTIREGSGPPYLKTTFVMDNPDGIAETRSDAVPVDKDGRKTHRVRIYKPMWVRTWAGTPAAGEGRLEPRWYHIDVANDDPGDNGIGLSTAYLDIERIDEFTTTTGSGPTYQKTRWILNWDHPDDTFKDQFFDSFLFSSVSHPNYTAPPDENGDPVGRMEDEDQQGNTITIPVTTDTRMPGGSRITPAPGRGWRLDPFQTIVNMRWGYIPIDISNTVYFQWRHHPTYWSAGVLTHPHPDPVFEITGLYSHNGYSEAAVRAAAAANDASFLPGQGPFGSNFSSIWSIIHILHPPDEPNDPTTVWFGASFIPPED